MYHYRSFITVYVLCRRIRNSFFKSDVRLSRSTPTSSQTSNDIHHEVLASSCQITMVIARQRSIIWFLDPLLSGNGFISLALCQYPDSGHVIGSCVMD